jgi:hypothetical protein
LAIELIIDVLPDGMISNQGQAQFTYPHSQEQHGNPATSTSSKSNQIAKSFAPTPMFTSFLVK